MSPIVTSDLHFGHTFIAILRGFFDDVIPSDITDKKAFIKANLSVEEINRRVSLMDELLIENWNNKVPHNEDVYVVGDFAFPRKKPINDILKSLNGKRKILISGNHDDKECLACDWHAIHDMKTVKYNKKEFVLCHYPFATWNKSHYGSYNLHGHCHGSYRDSSQQMDVGVDTNNLTPYTFDECLEKMSRMPKFVVPDHHGES